MPRLDIKNLEKHYTKRFIDAITKDALSSKHGSETNTQILWPARTLLAERERCPQLSLEQIIRGMLNFTLALEDAKYQVVTVQRAGEDYPNYRKATYKWWDAYNRPQQNDSVRQGELFVRRAIPAIESASHGDLYTMTACASNTLALYFEYAQKLNKNFQIPSPLSGHPGYDDFEFKVVTQKVGRNHLDEKTRLNQSLNNLRAKIDELENDPKISPHSIEKATTLHQELQNAANVYLDEQEKLKQRPYSSSSSHDPRRVFVAACTALINEAKPTLEKELGWGSYLTNLLKVLANTVIAGVNKVFNSSFLFFTLEKALLVSEVEDFEDDVELGSQGQNL
ncbi:MAG: hypothetical protein P4L65_07900 [Legionella sp.]|nr:hypothetical protein [Legionella sp.]